MIKNVVGLAYNGFLLPWVSSTSVFFVVWSLERSNHPIILVILSKAAFDPTGCCFLIVPTGGAVSRCPTVDCLVT